MNNTSISRLVRRSELLRAEPGRDLMDIARQLVREGLYSPATPLSDIAVSLLRQRRLLPHENTNHRTAA